MVGSAIFHTDRRTWQHASAHKPDSSSPIYLYIYFRASFFAPHHQPHPHLFGSCQIGSKAHQIQRYSFTFFLLYHRRLQLRGVGGGKKKKQSVWLEISDSTAFPDIPLYVSNQQLNVNASLAPVGTIGAESVCVCLTPKCLKCPLSALLSSPPPLPSRLNSFFFPLTLLLLYMQKTQHQVCGSADWTHLLQTFASVPSPVR